MYCRCCQDIIGDELIKILKRDYVFFCFFSSRRRHTRFDCDWSSDVCSSDLPLSRSMQLERFVATSTTAIHGRAGVPSCDFTKVPGRRTDWPSLDQLGLPPSCHRSEEHTSELQSQSNLVCRLLLEKTNGNIAD